MTDGRGGSVTTVTAGRSIPALAATACVRVRDRRGDVVGSGFLVSPDLVATCAHVVATATGTDACGPAPEVPVFVDFPAVATGPVERTARVHRWVPVEEDGTGDVSLLRLRAPAPPEAIMPPVRQVDHLWGHPFRVFGFPDGRWDGVWATGRFRAGQGTGSAARAPGCRCSSGRPQSSGTSTSARCCRPI